MNKARLFPTTVGSRLGRETIWDRSFSGGACTSSSSLTYSFVPFHFPVSRFYFLPSCRCSQAPNVLSARFVRFASALSIFKRPFVLVPCNQCPLRLDGSRAALALHQVYFLCRRASTGLLLLNFSVRWDARNVRNLTSSADESRRPMVRRKDCVEASRRRLG